MNREKGFLIDIHEENQTDPPTQWFIATTDKGRRLKIVFIRASKTEIDIKTAYEPNATEIEIYEKHAVNPTQ